MHGWMNSAAGPGADLTWAAGINRSLLFQHFGPPTVGRGEAYARDGAVYELTFINGGRGVIGNVRGSAGRSYQTAVTVPATFPQGQLASSCTCPMVMRCKHAVALLLAAKSAARSPADPAGPPWESTLAALVDDSDETTGTAVRLGLSFEVVDSARVQYGMPGRPRLRLRPLRPGANRGWIKARSSWRDVEYDYERPGFVPAHRQALLALLGHLRAEQRSQYSYGEQSMHLDDLGPVAWPLLRSVQSSGVEFVQATRSSGAVRVEREPVRLVVDAARQQDDGSVLLRPSLRTHDGHPLDAAAVVPTGDPAHGLWWRDGPDLVLAPLEHTLTAQAIRWVTDADPLRVPASDVPRLLSRYYPALRRQQGIESADGSLNAPEVHPPRLWLTATFGEEHDVRLSWGFAYQVDDVVTTVAVRGPSPDVARDPAAERALLASLDVLDAVPGLRIDVGAERLLVPDTVVSGWDAVLFTTDVLPVLRDRDDLLVDVVGSPRDYREVHERPAVHLDLSDDDDSRDWFNLAVTVRVGSRDVPFEPLFAALGRGDELLLLDDGAWFRLDHPELQQLRRLIEQSRELVDPDSGDLRVSAFHAGLWDELVSLGVVEQQSERWRRTVGALLRYDDVPEPPEPQGLRATLRPYQHHGFVWLSALRDLGLGGVLADDMGLGKTLQTLAMIQGAVEQGDLQEPVLIVAPTSVVSTWASEAARFTPELRVAGITETSRRSGTALTDLTADAHVVVTSYALLRIDSEAYLGTSWGALVLDEAQFVKNHRTSTYQCARRVTAPFKLAITGTPLENSLMDLWSLLSIVAPGLFPDPKRFAETYRKPIEAGTAPELLATLRRRIRPLMMRRTKEQVAPELPPKQEQVLKVALNPRHEKVYQTQLQRERQRVLGMLDDLQTNRIAILRSLTVLRQMSLDPSLVDARHAGMVRPSKVDALMDQLGEVVAEGHRALVFSQFTGFLKVVRAALDDAGVGYCYLDGRTRDRPRRIAEFTQGSAPVFLISLKAGGFGLTLTEADYVFVLDPWWNPAAETQAVDRTHRIGQDKTVMVYRLVAADTIEEKVVALQERKRALFDQVVADGDALSGPLSADDIRALVTE